MATFNGTFGNDTYTGTTANDSIAGNSGNDRLFGGAAGNDLMRGGDGRDTVYGDSGDDTLYGDGGDDTLYGGAGNDTLYDGAGSDTLDGGDGNDTINASSGFNTVYGGAGEDTVYGGTQDDIVWAGSGDDYVQGNDGNDMIAGNEGTDRIYGGFGDDVLAGGQGSDTIYGEAGNDFIVGDGQLYDIAAFALGPGTTATTLTVTNGADGPIDLHFIDSFGATIYYATIQPGETYVQSTFVDHNWVLMDPNGYYLQVIEGAADQTYTYAGPFNDTVYAGIGDDTVMGQYGDDELHGEDGSDQLSGEYGNDTLYGGASADTLSGDQGNDALYAGSGDDTVYGGDGNDVVGNWSMDDSGNDAMFGDAGNDSIIGGAGNDTVYGGIGDDGLSGQHGFDTLYGGDGQDYFTITDDHEGDIVFGGEGGVDNDLLALSTYLSTQGVNVTFTGSEAGNYAYVQPGMASGTFSEIETVATTQYDDTVDASASSSAQTVYAGGGNDTVIGGTGNDDLQGGTGNDSIYSGSGNDLVMGGDGDDFIVSGTGDDVVFGGAGNDILDDVPGADDGQGNDQFFGGDGDDVVWAGTDNDIVFGDAGNDTISGQAGDDIMSGGIGNDSVYGNEGDDVLFGDAGTDILDGGIGNDVLVGGADDDTLVTGAGNDTVFLDIGGGTDTVTDFSLTDTDSDGFYDDQIDVSALRDLEGNPIDWRDVVVTDDGAGNALLTFPMGERLILQGISPSQMNTGPQMYAAGIPCFTAGTMILTPTGEVPVERLRAGDMVVTRDNGPRPVVWAGARHLDRAALAARPDLAPVRVAPGVWAGPRGLLVSPQHAVLVRSGAGGGDEAFVRARHLARMRGGKVRVAHGVRAVTYVHVMFEGHQVIWANGVASESFYPGRWGMAALDASARREIASLFPMFDTGSQRMGTRGEGAIRRMPPESPDPAARFYGPMARATARFRDLPDRIDALSLALR